MTCFTVINLKTGREHIHMIDSEFELNAANGELVDFYDVNIEDNYTFETANIRYRLQTPNTPEKVLNFNMGTRKVE